MRIMRVLHANRLVLALGLIGMLAMSGGCNSDPNATAGAPIAKDQQDAERAAREKAFGKAVGNPGKSAAPKKTK